jgi:hypothetical protein
MAGNPKTWLLSAQFGGTPGLYQNYNPTNGQVNLAGLSVSKYHELVCVPSGNSVCGINGTLTVRAPGEVLMRIMCDGILIWQGETRCMNWAPMTLVINIPVPYTWGLCGNFYIAYDQISFSDQPYGDGEFWEYNLVIQGQ